MLIPSRHTILVSLLASLSRRVNANSQREYNKGEGDCKLIKKGEC